MSLPCPSSAWTPASTAGPIPGQRLPLMRGAGQSAMSDAATKVAAVAIAVAGTRENRAAAA